MKIEDLEKLFVEMSYKWEETPEQMERLASFAADYMASLLRIACKAKELIGDMTSDNEEFDSEEFLIIQTWIEFLEMCI